MSEYLWRSKSGKMYDLATEKNPDAIGNESRNGFLYDPSVHPKGIKFQKQCKNAMLRAINAVHNRKSYHFDGDLKILHDALCASIKSRITDDPSRKQPFMLNAADILVYYIQNPNELHKSKKIKLFMKSVDVAHDIIKEYDPNAFIYEDVRLQKLSDVLKNWDDQTFSKIFDSCLFLMKEDVYYRPRWIQIAQDINSTVNEICDSSNTLLDTLNSVCKACVDMELMPDEIANIERWH